jgi:hypothetical protein
MGGPVFIWQQTEWKMSIPDTKAALAEVFRQVDAHTRALKERLAKGGDLLATLEDTIRFLGRTSDACEIGLALVPDDPVLDKIMQEVAGELVQACTAIVHLRKKRAAEAAQQASRPKEIPKRPQNATLH